MNKIILDKLKELIGEFIIIYLRSGITVQGTLKNILNNENTDIAEAIELSYGSAMTAHKNYDQWESITCIQIYQIDAVKYDRLEKPSPLTLKK